MLIGASYFTRSTTPEYRTDPFLQTVLPRLISRTLSTAPDEPARECVITQYGWPGFQTYERPRQPVEPETYQDAFRLYRETAPGGGDYGQELTQVFMEPANALEFRIGWTDNRGWVKMHPDALTSTSGYRYAPVYRGLGATISGSLVRQPLGYGYDLTGGTSRSERGWVRYPGAGGKDPLILFATGQNPSVGVWQEWYGGPFASIGSVQMFQISPRFTAELGWNNNPTVHVKFEYTLTHWRVLGYYLHWTSLYQPVPPPAPPELHTLFTTGIYLPGYLAIGF